MENTALPTAAAAALALALLRRLRAHSSSAAAASSHDEKVDVDLDRSGQFAVKHDFCPDGAIPMWVADMDLPVSNGIQEAIVARARQPSYGYTTQPPELWAAVSAWLAREHGWNVPTEHFVFTANLVAGASHSIQAFTAEGDAILTCVPLYGPLRQAVTKNKRRLVELDMPLWGETPAGGGDGTAREQGGGGRYGVDVAALRAAFQRENIRMLIWCSPHNPGGVVWTRAELREVVQACVDFDVCIISDEVHADLVLPSAAAISHVPTALVCTELGYERVVTLSSPGKTWNLAGLHGAFVVIESAAMRAAFLERVECGHLNFGSTFATTGMLAAYTHGKPWLLQARAHIAGNVARVATFLAKHVPEIAPILPQASYLVWLDCTQLSALLLASGGDGAPQGEGKGEGKVEDKGTGTGEGASEGASVAAAAATAAALDRFFVNDAGLMLSGGAQFAGADADTYQRMNVACSRKTLDTALERLRGAVGKLRGAARGKEG